jgi:hypothetical protein
MKWRNGCTAPSTTHDASGEEAMSLMHPRLANLQPVGAG